MATNLNEFYTSKGQALPSIAQRQGDAAKAGIQNYIGTAQQNTQLLNFLKNQPTTPAMPASTNVNANVISATTQPVNIPPATITNPAPAQNVVPQIQQSLADKAVAQSKVEDTDIQKLVREIAMQDALAAGNLTGQTQALADAEKAAGVETKKQDLQNLNNQILQKQAEINQSDVQLVANMRAEERRDTLLPFAQSSQAKLAGDAAILRGLKTAEIGVLNARALATQGDIELAKETAQRAVDLKYAPYKELIAIHKAQLEALNPILTADEKKQAQEQTIRGNIALKEIEKISKFQSDALTNAITNNAPQSVLSKINNAQSIEEITRAGGQYIVSQADRLDLALKRAQLAKANTVVGTGTSAKPLSGDAAKVFSISSGLQTDVNSIKNKINQLGYKKFLQGYLAGTDRESVRLVANAADKLGRLRSGGAINKDEEKRFIQQFASAADLAFGSKEKAFTTLDSIFNEAQTVQQGVAPKSMPVSSYVDTVVSALGNQNTTSASDFAASLLIPKKP